MEQTLLCDRLSQPMGDMASALLSLQPQTVLLEEFAQRGSTEKDISSILLLSMGYCILFGYEVQADGAESRSHSLGKPAKTRAPVQPADFVAAFNGALRRPEEFLQDLMALRAQTVPRETVMRISPLVDDVPDDNPSAYAGPYASVLRPLATYLKAAVECADLYADIRDGGISGRLDRQQVSQLLSGDDSDQKKMMNAMGVVGEE